MELQTLLCETTGKEMSSVAVGKAKEHSLSHYFHVPRKHGKNSVCSPTLIVAVTWLNGIRVVSAFCRMLQVGVRPITAHLALPSDHLGLRQLNRDYFDGVKKPFAQNEGSADVSPQKSRTAIISATIFTDPTESESKTSGLNFGSVLSGDSVTTE